MLKNVGSNWALSALQILVFMVLSPFVVNALGKDGNGVWVTIVGLTDPLRLLILGVPMASVRYIAEHVSRRDTERANDAIATCLGICLFMGAVALIVSLVLFAVFERVYLASSDWALLDPATVREAPAAFALMVATVTLGFAGRLPYGIFDAHHDFIVRNLVLAGGLVLKLALTVGLLSIDASLTLLAIVQVACMVFEFAVAVVLVQRRHAGIRFRLRGFDRSLVRSVLSFSVFAMLLNVGAQLAFRTDALVIGWFETPVDVTIYDIGNKIFEPFTSLLLGIGMVVMPMATSLRAKGEESGLRSIFERWTKIALAVTLAAGLYLLVLGPEFLAWWFAGQYLPEMGRLLRVLMVSFLVFLPVRGVALPLLMGIGRPARPALALLVAGAANVALSVALIGPLGLVGVALGTAIPNVVFSVYVWRLACRELGAPALAVPGWVLTRGALGWAPPLLFLVVLDRAFDVSGFVALAASGLVYAGLFAALWAGVVLRGDPHVDPWARFAAARARAAAGSDPP